MGGAGGQWDGPWWRAEEVAWRVCLVAPAGTPAPVLKVVLRRCEPLLRRDAKARQHFVTSGGLMRLQVRRPAPQSAPHTLHPPPAHLSLHAQQILPSLAAPDGLQTPQPLPEHALTRRPPPCAAAALQGLEAQLCDKGRAHLHSINGLFPEDVVAYYRRPGGVAGGKA